MSKCEKCGYDDKGTGDSAHYCPSASGPLAPRVQDQDMSEQSNELEAIRAIDIDAEIKKRIEGSASTDGVGFGQSPLGNANVHLRYPKKKSEKPETARPPSDTDIVGFGCYHTKVKRYD